MCKGPQAYNFNPVLDIKHDDLCLLFIMSPVLLRILDMAFLFFFSFLLLLATRELTDPTRELTPLYHFLVL